MEFDQVITLIADVSKQELQQDIIDGIIEKLNAEDGQAEHVWLSQRKACDIFFENTSIAEAELIAKTYIADAPIDMIVQPVQGREKKLLISDMDSTIINQECIDEIAAFAGIKDRVSEITEKAMNGELDFKEALVERVGLLQDLPVSVLEEVYQNHITFMEGAKELVRVMRQNGAYCVLVSGGFTFFTRHVADEVGFQEQSANQLDIADDKLTGKVVEPILDKEAKLDALHHFCQKLDITSRDVLAVGDGANDLPMLQAAGLGVAYHAKPTVQEQADYHINYCGLDALIYAQGYSE